MIVGPIWLDPLSKTRMRSNRCLGEESPDDHERQAAVVAPENSADLDLLEPDRPPAYTSKMPEETCGVMDKVAPSRRSTK